VIFMKILNKKRRRNQLSCNKMVEEKNNQRELIYKKMRLIKQHTDSFQNFVNRFVRKIGRIKADKDFSFATRNRKILSEVKIFSNNFNYQIEKIITTYF